MCGLWLAFKRGLTTSAIAAVALSSQVANAQINLNQGAYMTPAVDAHFDVRLNKTLPGILTFTNSRGKSVNLDSYFATHVPIVFMMPSYKCKLDCAAEMRGLAVATKDLSLKLGKDYQIVTVSLSPNDQPGDARAAAGRAWSGLSKNGVPPAGWHALVGNETNIVKLAENLGVHYIQDASKNNFNNPTGIIITTGSGRIYRYIYGVQFMPSYLQSSLREAGDGKLGIPTEQQITYCYGYKNPTGVIGRRLQDLIVFSGCLTAIVVAGFIGLSIANEVTGRKKPPTVAV